MDKIVQEQLPVYAWSREPVEIGSAKRWIVDDPEGGRPAVAVREVTREVYAEWIRHLGFHNFVPPGLHFYELHFD